LIERFSQAPAQEDNPDQVQQGHGQHEQGDQDNPTRSLSFRGVEVREDGQDGQEIADEVAAGIAQESSSAGEVVWQETQQGAQGQQGNQGDEILALGG